MLEGCFTDHNGVLNVLVGVHHGLLLSRNLVCDGHLGPVLRTASLVCTPVAIVCSVYMEEHTRELKLPHAKKMLRRKAEIEKDTGEIEWDKGGIEWDAGGTPGPC